MVAVGYWVGVVAASALAGLRPGAAVEHTFEGVRLTQAPRADDPVLLVALATPPVVFGVGRVHRWFAYGQAKVSVVFTPCAEVALAGGRLVAEIGAAIDAGPGLYAVSRATFTGIDGIALSERGTAAPAPLLPEWLVSLSLPIEAATAAEAVREFWSYVLSLGQSELPAFVWPRGDELALQAYVSSEPVSLDPEQD